MFKQDRNQQDVGDQDGIPKDDAGTVEDENIYKEGSNDDHGNGIEDHNMSGGEASDEGDLEFEDDDSGSYSDGGSDDDDDDGDEEDDDDDIDKEDYYDDDEEEETDEEDEDNR